MRDEQARFIDKVRIAAVAELYLPDDFPQKFEICLGYEHSSWFLRSGLQWHGQGYVWLGAVRRKHWAYVGFAPRGRQKWRGTVLVLKIGLEIDLSLREFKQFLAFLI